MNPKFQTGVPREYLSQHVQDNKSTFENTCDACKRICQKLLAHEFKVHVSSWVSSLAKNFLASRTGTTTTLYCERRMCDACFRRAAPSQLTCRKNDCQALITFDLKAQCFEYDDYLNDVVFNCPLDMPCNQRLTYADFMKHVHHQRKKEKKKVNALPYSIPAKNELEPSGPQAFAKPPDVARKINHHENEIKKLNDLSHEIFELEKKLNNTRKKREIGSVQINRLLKEQEIFDKEIKELEKSIKDKTSLLEPEENDENCCGVCMEGYNSTNCKRACISTCFHCFCFSCLNSLNSKHCPKCRNPFTNDQIKKLF